MNGPASIDWNNPVAAKGEWRHAREEADRFRRLYEEQVRRAESAEDALDASNETQASITGWQSATFGQSTREAVYERMMKEVREMIAAHAEERWHDVAKELPDVYITLCRLASYLGRDLHSDVDAKMLVNRAREWQVDATGNGQHVRKPDEAP